MSISPDNDRNDHSIADQSVRHGFDPTIAPMDREALAAHISQRPSRFWLAIVASFVIHGAIAWAGINYANNDVLGGAEVEIETISVEIVGSVPKVPTSTLAQPAKPTDEATANNEQPQNKDATAPPPITEPAARIDPPPAALTGQGKSKVARSVKPISRKSGSIPEDFPRKLPQAPDPKIEPKAVTQKPERSEVETVPREPALIEKDLPMALLKTPTAPPQASKRPTQQEQQSEREAESKVEEDNSHPLNETADSKTQKSTKEIRKLKEDERERTTKRPVPASSASSSVSQRSSPNQRKFTSASKGALRLFARRVARALARSRPRRITATGTVLIAFTLSESGRLNSVRVRKSSGNVRIDRAAKRAVQRAKLPRPPKGATRKQRSFVIPYHFRRR